MSRLKRNASDIELLRGQDLSQEMLFRLQMLFEQLPDATDWLVVKKALMLELCPADRQLFSRRHEDSKKHFPFNALERRIRETWVKMGGNVLLMPDDKKMEDVDPAGYL